MYYLFFAMLNLTVSGFFMLISIVKGLPPYSMIPNLLLGFIFGYLWFRKNLTSHST